MSSHKTRKPHCLSDEFPSTMTFNAAIVGLRGVCLTGVVRAKFVSYAPVIAEPCYQDKVEVREARVRRMIRTLVRKFPLSEGTGIFKPALVFYTSNPIRRYGNRRAIQVCHDWQSTNEGHDMWRIFNAAHEEFHAAWDKRVEKEGYMVGCDSL